MFRKSICLILAALVLSFAPARSARADETGTDMAVGFSVGVGLATVFCVILAVTQTGPNISGHVKNEKDPNRATHGLAQNAPQNLIDQSIKQAFVLPTAHAQQQIAKVDNASLLKTVTPGVGYSPTTHVATLGLAGAF